jgi:hypothetical protein
MGVLGLLIGTGTRPVGVEVIGGFLFGAMTNTFQFYVVWVVFRLFLRLQAGQILTTELLHSHLCWGFLTLYFLLVSGSALYVEATWLPWTLGLALLLYIAALHTGLGLARIKRAGKSGRRLLLLRTFSKDRNRENLLDSLDDRWRRIGRIDLITGTDLAVRTLAGRMLEAFLLRRVDDQFLKTREEVNRRLEHLRSDIEGDVRYPVNSVSCYESAWQHALGQLVPESDVLLMDLRGFTMENRGCRFELIYVVQRVGLRRVIVLVDRRTDVDALTRTAQGAWEELPSDSPNVLDPEPVLNVLRFDAPTERNADALFSLLLDAATTEDPAVQQGMRVATEAVS